jgi:short-subunit dehydrogenase
MRPIHKQAIVITGASSGAGRAAALEFAKYRPALILASRNEEILRQVAAECEDLGAAAKVIVPDVADPKSMISLANDANTWGNRIDVYPQYPACG